MNLTALIVLCTLLMYSYREFYNIIMCILMHTIYSKLCSLHVCWLHWITNILVFKSLLLVFIEY